MWGSVKNCLQSFGFGSKTIRGKRSCPSGEDGCVVDWQQSKRVKYDRGWSVEHMVLQLLLARRQLSARGLARLSCVNKAFSKASEDESLWHSACSYHWPSTVCPEVHQHITAAGGYRRFFSLRHHPGGEIQPSVPSTDIETFFANKLFLMDVLYHGRPRASFRCLKDGKLGKVPLENGIAFRMPDVTMNSVIAESRGVVRRSLEQLVRNVSVDCCLMRANDHKAAYLLLSSATSTHVVGNTAFATYKSEFHFPGVFESTRATTEVIISLTAVERSHPTQGGGGSPPNVVHARRGGGAARVRGDRGGGGGMGRGVRRGGQAGGSGVGERGSIECDLTLGELGFEVKLEVLKGVKKRFASRRELELLHWK